MICTGPLPLASLSPDRLHQTSSILTATWCFVLYIGGDQRDEGKIKYIHLNLIVTKGDGRTSWAPPLPAMGLSGADTAGVRSARSEIHSTARRQPADQLHTIGRTRRRVMLHGAAWTLAMSRTGGRGLNLFGLESRGRPGVGEGNGRVAVPVWLRDLCDSSRRGMGGWDDAGRWALERHRRGSCDANSCQDRPLRTELEGPEGREGAGCNSSRSQASHAHPRALARVRSSPSRPTDRDPFQVFEIPRREWKCEYRPLSAYQARLWGGRSRRSASAIRPISQLSRVLRRARKTAPGRQCQAACCGERRGKKVPSSSSLPRGLPLLCETHKNTMRYAQPAGWTPAPRALVQMKGDLASLPPVPGQGDRQSRRLPLSCGTRFQDRVAHPRAI